MQLSSVGSSPLTRGKLGDAKASPTLIRLIPAHAGKTRQAQASPQWLAAHPRSRGENRGRALEIDLLAGSSPLTRGKLVAVDDDVPGIGLIPAHAGKTVTRFLPRCHARAHPRSRGENADGAGQLVEVRGSSPLTRGKPSSSTRRPAAAGLIPAHAGKTRAATTAPARLTAHPRSRGENGRGGGLRVGLRGSSPLTRGKPRARHRKPRQARLIPAHAGKTAPAPPSSSSTAAHPRSRGENRASLRKPRRAAGSSPLTRGKPGSSRVSGVGRRLIPAHAGKTRRGVHCPAFLRAHPRSRGENPF